MVAKEIQYKLHGCTYQLRVNVHIILLGHETHDIACTSFLIQTPNTVRFGRQSSFGTEVNDPVTI